MHSTSGIHSFHLKSETLSNKLVLKSIYVNQAGCLIRAFSHFTCQKEISPQTASWMRATIVKNCVDQRGHEPTIHHTGVLTIRPPVPLTIHIHAVNKEICPKILIQYLFRSHNCIWVETPNVTIAVPLWVHKTTSPPPLKQLNIV